jgi:cardiolipin synthase
LDGKLARRWNQVTRLGQALDPIADRMYTLAAVAGLLARGILPWWLVVIMLTRDLLMAVNIGVIRRSGYGSFEVNFTGKAATFCLMYAFPLLLLTHHGGRLSNISAAAGWAFVIWGVTLYWWSASRYTRQAFRIRKAAIGCSSTG